VTELCLVVVIALRFCEIRVCSCIEHRCNALIGSVSTGFSDKLASLVEAVAIAGSQDSRKRTIPCIINTMRDSMHIVEVPVLLSSVPRSTCPVERQRLGWRMASRMLDEGSSRKTGLAH
jgi:hypothetical protein